jgi:cobaltochelatase CobT
MGEPQTVARQQQRVEELCVAAIRALARASDLHFRGRRLHRGGMRLPLYAPHLHPSIEHDDFASFRGAADGLALRLAWSDDALHRSLAPQDRVERMVFEMLEQFRVESLAASVWPGVQRNLQHRFDTWLLAFHHSGLTESASGILLFTVAQVCRARVTQQPVLEATEDLMEATRAGIGPLIGRNLAELRRARHDQAAYAAHALAIAAQVARLLEEAGQEKGPSGDAERENDPRLAFGLLMEDDDKHEVEAVASIVKGRGRVPEASVSGYRVFTTAYDREFRPATQIRETLLAEYRQRLDTRVAEQGLNIARLARQLKALLAVPARDDWASAQEEGLIDGRRLAQLVASPTERRLFRHELREPQADCVVALLIDCSGSMCQHIESVALLVDVFARALDMAGVASEILGFTTGAWNGGRALRDWRRAGSPPHPGRLNEVAHLVFKDGDTPWRRARRSIAALLKAELFRESVDGEALAWAAARLAARGETRRLLIVVSDGCPMDGATQLANDEHYLDHHLQQVAAKIEADGLVELAAIGVGLDLSPYYGHCQAIDLDSGLGNRVFQEVLALIGRRGHR